LFVVRVTLSLFAPLSVPELAAPRKNLSTKFGTVIPLTAVPLHSVQITLLSSVLALVNLLY
jgi:hypothetical protein